MGNKELIVGTDKIKSKIYTVRGKQVMLDKDLAVLYNIETRALKQAVNRNKRRFPLDFMFVLSENETDIMVSQNVIPSKKYLGGALPYAFTEQGVANLASVLTSNKAIEVNIKIMRAFVAMRHFVSSEAHVFRRLDNVEIKLIEHDKQFDKVFDAIPDEKYIRVEIP